MVRLETADCLRQGQTITGFATENLNYVLNMWFGLRHQKKKKVVHSRTFSAHGMLTFPGGVGAADSGYHRSS